MMKITSLVGLLVVLKFQVALAETIKTSVVMNKTGIFETAARQPRRPKSARLGSNPVPVSQLDSSRALDPLPERKSDFPLAANQ